MVADRAAFLEAGHYAGVSARARRRGARGRAERCRGGCWTWAGAPASTWPPSSTGPPARSGVVLDSSPYAARRAARAHPRAMAVVADTWARLPVRDGAVDRVLVVFAPRNGPEIARVLDPDGRLVVVTPAADHLGELVGPLGLLRVDPDKAARLAGFAGTAPGAGHPHGPPGRAAPGPRRRRHARRHGAARPAPGRPANALVGSPRCRSRSR